MKGRPEGWKEGRNGGKAGHISFPFSKGTEREHVATRPGARETRGRGCQLERGRINSRIEHSLNFSRVTYTFSSSPANFTFIIAFIVSYVTTYKDEFKSDYASLTYISYHKCCTRPPTTPGPFNYSPLLPCRHQILRLSPSLNFAGFY